MYICMYVCGDEMYKIIFVPHVSVDPSNSKSCQIRT